MVCNKYKEIFPSTSSFDRIPRSADKFSGDDIHFTTRKSLGFERIVSKVSLKQICEPLERNKCNRDLTSFPSSEVCSYETLMHLNISFVKRLKWWINNVELLMTKQTGARGGQCS